MPSNKKRRIRERREKTGESYSTARRHLDAAIEPILAPTGSVWLDQEGRALPNDGTNPEAEVVGVMDFDGADRDKAWVPGTAFDDPSMPRRPDMPPGTKRVLSLAEYIKLRERKTGWKLLSLQPNGEFMGMFVTVIISWDVRTKAQRGER